MAKRKWLILAVVVAVAGVFVALGLNRDSQVQHFTAKVERGDIHDVVEATGTINSVITVQVGSQVSGTIAKLNADFNSRVHKGDVVALIDPALFKGALLQASADLKNSEANLAAARTKHLYRHRRPERIGLPGSSQSHAGGIGADGSDRSRRHRNNSASAAASRLPGGTGVAAGASG